MGLGIVLLLWAVVGIVVASLGAVLLASAVAFFTRGGRGRRRVIILAAVFPFICLGWGAAVVIVQGIVNETFLHRDFGLGDAWRAPLPNGYSILMIDVTDQGWVYNPTTQLDSSGVVEKEDAVSGVRYLQISGPYILGSSDSHSFEHAGTDSKEVDSYFLLDTATGKRTNFADYESLHRIATEHNIRLNLEPIDSVYSRYRFSWFDVFVGVLFVLPPMVAFLTLVLWVMRVRRTRVALVPA